MSVPELIVEIAWTAGPYDVSPTWTPVSQYVKKVSVRRGRGSDFDDTFSSNATITFDNNARLFDPFNSSGPNFANLKPRKQVRIRGLINGTYYPIFRGYINGFPVTWSNSGFSSTVTVQAYDLLSLLATDNLSGDLADIYTRSLNPYHYYKCNDPNGSSIIKDYGSAGENLTIVSGYSGKQFSSSYPLGIGLSGSSADISNTFYSKYNSSVTSTTSNLTFCFWGAWPSGFSGEQTTGIAGVTTADSITFYPNSPSTGIGLVENYGATSPHLAGAQTSLTKVTTSAPSHYVFRYNGSTVTIFINGVNRTGSAYSGSAASLHFPTRNVWLWGGLFQEVAIFNTLLSDAQISDIYKFGAGSATETTSARASRLMALTDVPAGLYSISGTSYGEVLGVPEPNMNIRDALAQVMRTEAGYLFVTKAGILTTQHRNYFLTNATSTTSQATISDTGSGVIGYMGDVEIWYDGDNFRNDIAVDYGTGIQALASNQTSIDTYGKHTYNVTTQSSTTAEAQEIADHWYTYYSALVPSVSSIEVGLGASTNSEWATILSLEVLDRITFKRTPSSGSVFQQDLSLNQIEFDLVPTRWSVKLNGSARFAPTPPLSSVSSASSISSSSATLNGTVSANYFSSTVTFQYGTDPSFATYSTATATQSPVISQNVSVSVTVSISAGYTYYYRIVATSTVGTTTSSSTSFVASNALPDVVASAPSYTLTTASLSGTVDANGSSSSVYFDYGTSLTFATFTTVVPSQSPVAANTPTAVSISLSGLTTGQTYYWRIRATNSIGTTTTNGTTFTTAFAPSVTLNDITSYNSSSAGLYAVVDWQGKSTTTTFAYSSNGGATWSSEISSTPSPVTNSSTTVTGFMGGLSEGTTYLVRATSTNAIGTATSQKSFTTYRLKYVHFTGSGTWTAPTWTGVTSTTAFYGQLIAAGGGSGGFKGGGGGGGGQATTGTSFTLSNSMVATIGAGGADGGSGGNSTCTNFGVTAIGGNSGGFGSIFTNPDGGYSGNGNAGGAGFYNIYGNAAGGGGGGNGGAGGNYQSGLKGGNAGVGSYPTYAGGFFGAGGAGAGDGGIGTRYACTYGQGGTYGFSSTGGYAEFLYYGPGGSRSGTGWTEGNY